ncbi:hypothetical protein PVAND_003501 [Polypedilum vanderplanki]|uniref:DAGKc domain-containing protein n=1 Tax=Polypedilum vanderplanki TaxID=319348 RepID=A0A9J6BU87_POLVA|nr:hypothetical protein PVAND_003501 [Polypedilum vanderplanki]
MDNGAYQPEQEIKSSILLNTFQIDKKSYRVFYNNETLIWEKIKNNKSKVIIPIHDVISVCYPKRKSSQPTPQVTPSLTSPQHTQQIYHDANDDNRSITINYAKRCIDPKVESGKSSKNCGDRNKWRIHSVTLHSNDKYIIKEWHDTLNKILNALKRPRKLLLFINPYGGKKNALQLYEKYAKPIFRMANVDVSVIISQRPNQIFDLVMQQQLDQYDGIICSGGDGTFSELFNGLIYRKMLSEHSNGMESNEELNLDNENIPSPDIPCGIIPAGSTDTIAYCLHGTTDIKTCIIHIVLGQVSGFDISSISNDKGLIKFYASVVAYGFLGDISFEQENYRFLGPRRYEWVGFKKVLLNRGYDVEVLIHQDNALSSTNQGQNSVNNCDKIKCYENCSVCSMPSTSTANMKKANEEEKFKKITGRFFMVNLANISCACQRSPSGMSPYCHLADGYNDIILVRHGNIFQNLRFLIKLSSKTGQITDFPFVEMYRTNKVYFKALNSTSEGSLTDSTQPISNLGPNKYTSVWNCDGEIVQDTDVIIRAHRKLLPVFYRGPVQEDLENKSRGCCCC